MVVPAEGIFPMNVPALAIAACLGAAFFAAEYTWQYQPDFINPDEIWSMLQSDHRKAQAAVSRTLIEPRSAAFNGLANGRRRHGEIVCGSVKAMDREAVC